MSKPAILFDLDMTLVDTFELTQLRNARLWDQLRDNLHLAKEFPFSKVSPHHLPGLLKKLGHPVAIVTNTPGRYAKTIMHRFGIDCDLLVTYEDTTEHKPEPTPLLYALEKLGCPPSNAYHIGDEVGDMEASFRAGVKPIGAGWGIKNLVGISGTAPDILVYEPDLLLELSEVETCGYFLEMQLEGKQFLVHNGAVLKWNDGGIPIFALGRYFPERDPRHACSVLSQKLIDMKTSPTATVDFAFALALFIEHILEKAPDEITCVPPKPGQHNRFSPIFDQLTGLISNGIKISPSGLAIKKVVQGYKVLGASERQGEMRDAYFTERKWHGTVLVVDDVSTSGATMRECARVLQQSGASQVIGVVFGKNQYGSFLELKKCPICGKQMSIKVNRQELSPRYGCRFWSCSGWKRDGSGCNYTENIDG